MTGYLGDRQLADQGEMPAETIQDQVVQQK